MTGCGFSLFVWYCVLCLLCCLVHVSFGRCHTVLLLIPKHMLTPYFAVMTVEEWAANSIAAYEFSHDVWAASEATDATAPRLWSSMVRMMTLLGMEWSAPVYRGTPQLQVGVNGQQNADIMESGIVAMAQQLGLLIKRTGARTPLGDADADDPMTNSSTSSVGAMDMICVAVHNRLCLSTWM